MIVFILFAAASFLVAAGFLAWNRLRFRTGAGRLQRTNNKSKIRGIQKLASRHEVAWHLSELIEKDGAGDWPPKANHDNWPRALRPYKDIYFELVPLLSAAPPSLDDDVNTQRRSNYRSLMRKLLAERINISEVKSILAAVENGEWEVLPRDAYNGFYCCVAVCRHAYRWATIPVVKVAQLEKVVDFPPELDEPWPYLQRNFGVEADSGNNTANVVHNFDANGERVYKINVSMNDLIKSSEETFFRMFFDLEILAFPIYYAMVHAVAAFDSGDKPSCVRHLEDVSDKLRTLLAVFYENVHDRRVSRSVWLSYVQGFQGWGVGRYVDGGYVKYDGLSGNHVLFFQALDAFLGLERYLTDENMDRYIPRNQRELCLAFKRNTLRGKMNKEDPEDERVEEALQTIVKQIRVFRAAHRSRVIPYLEQPAPERLPMTAGKSVLKGDTLSDALKVLDDLMVTRLRETQ